MRRAENRGGGDVRKCSPTQKTHLGVRDAVPRSPPLLPCPVPALEARQAPEHVQAEREVHVAEQRRRHHQVRQALRVGFVGVENTNDDDDMDGDMDDDMNEQGSEWIERHRSAKRGISFLQQYVCFSSQPAVHVKSVDKSYSRGSF